MKKYIFYSLFCFGVFAQCTLNASQEARLNKSVSNYTAAINKCQVTGIVGFTHPKVVKYYRDLGDSTFIAHFSCDPTNNTRITNSTLRKTASKNDEIHALFNFDVYNINNTRISNKEYQLVAISENNGENWFFIPYQEYQNLANELNLNQLLD